MHNYLLRLFFAATLSTSSTAIYGQDSISSKATSKMPVPLCIINSNIIVNSFFVNIDPKDIQKLAIYREGNAPDLLRNLASTGIIAITYDKPVSSKSFAEIGRQYGAHGPLRIVLNGQTLNATQQATLRIVPEAIGQLQVTQATPGNLETVVHIQTVETKPDTQKHDPGTIMIR